MYLALGYETQKRAVEAFKACQEMGLDEAITRAREEQKELEAQGYSYNQATMYAAKIMEDACGKCAVVEVLH